MVNPVIPFKVDCLALVEDRGRDLAAMIFRSLSRQDRLGLACHCRRWPISPLRLVLNLPPNSRGSSTSLRSAAYRSRTKL